MEVRTHTNAEHRYPIFFFLLISYYYTSTFALAKKGPERQCNVSKHFTRASAGSIQPTDCGICEYTILRLAGMLQQKDSRDGS